MSVKTKRDYFAGIILFKTLHGHGFNYLSNQIIYTNEQNSYNTRSIIIPDQLLIMFLFCQNQIVNYIKLQCSTMDFA